MNKKNKNRLVVLLLAVAMFLGNTKISMATSTKTGWQWEYVSSSNRYEWKFYNYKGVRINQFFKENGMTWLSYADPSKSYHRGWWTNPENGYRYFHRRTSGTMVKGWQFIDGAWRYFRSSGTLASGKQYINGQWYYLSNGAKTYGWKDINGKRYYFKPSSGTMVTGKQYINGKLYTFTSSGVLYNQPTITNNSIQIKSTNHKVENVYQKTMMDYGNGTSSTLGNLINYRDFIGVNWNKEGYTKVLFIHNTGSYKTKDLMSLNIGDTVKVNNNGVEKTYVVSNKVSGNDSQILYKQAGSVEYYEYYTTSTGIPGDNIVIQTCSDESPYIKVLFVLSPL